MTIVSGSSGPGWKGVALYDSHTNTPVRMAQFNGVTRVPVSSVLVDSSGNELSSVSTQGGVSLKVSNEADPADGFRGYGEVVNANGNNIDVWVGPTAIQPEPVPGGYQLWVESTSAADNGTSTTGVLTVEVHYLDTSGAQQSTGPITLDGQTPVNTGITDCMFVNTFHALTTGTGLVAAGRVDCTQGSGGAVVSSIAVAGNWALSTMRQIPTGKQLCLAGWHISSGVSAGGKLATVRLRSTSDEDGVLVPNVYLFKDTVILRDSAQGHIPVSPKIIVPALATIKISTWTSGAVNVAGRWQGWLEDV